MARPKKKYKSKTKDQIERIQFLLPLGTRAAYDAARRAAGQRSVSEWIRGIVYREMQATLPLVQGGAELLEGLPVHPEIKRGNWPRDYVPESET